MYSKLALVDNRCRFLAVESAGYGRQHDAGNFGNSALLKLLNRARSIVPEPIPLPGSTIRMHYVILADSAYP